MRRFVAVVVVATTLIVMIAPSAAAGAGPSSEVEYRAPSDAPIVDRFDPPAERWMAGNRGIDYGTEAGAPIEAAADGRIAFAGSVGGALHVTILHADGLRTSYSFVDSITVDVGQQVVAGAVIAVAGGPFHFGVRAPDDTYLDPELLLSGRLRPTVRLVPGTDDGLDALRAAERRSLFEVIVGGGVAAMRAVGSWAADEASLLAHYAIELQSITHVRRVLDALRTWWESRSSCTPASTPVPVHSSPRVVVLVSGLGTSSSGNTALEIDTTRLGYAPQDVVPYSYAGGRGPRPRPADGATGVVAPAGTDPFGAIPQTDFDAADSQHSLSESADRLSVLLQEVAAARPGVPIDVIAHSQGGVVARLAVERSGDAGRLPDSVESLVTVASPQQGAPLATAVLGLGRQPGGGAALSQVRASGIGGELDDRLPAIGDLAETSATIDEMRTRQVPDRVRFVTIGGSGDFIVPGTSAIDPTADASVILPTGPGLAPHGSMPSTPAATREIGLAVAGMGPTCQTLGSTLSTAVMAETVRWGEAAGAVAAFAAAFELPIPTVD